MSGSVGKRERVAAHESRIAAMFDDIAARYDHLNRALSLGQDVLWRRAAARRARLAEREVALDVGTGSGDLAFALLARSAAGSRVVGLDLAEVMLGLAREKAPAHGAGERFTVVRGSTLAIPARDATFDRVVSAFTARNVADLPRAFGEMRRVLKDGGRLVLLELSRPAGAFARLYRFYFHGLLPRLAARLGGEPAAYAYLPRSLDAFPDVVALAELLRAAGFREVRYTRLSLGIATIHEGVR